MVPTTLSLLTPGDRPPGCFDLGGWERFGKWMLENGLLESPSRVADVAERLPRAYARATAFRATRAPTAPWGRAPAA